MPKVAKKNTTLNFLGRPGKRRVPERDGDVKQAQDRIAYLVRIGKIPSAKCLVCVVCGVTAAEYHHHRGYGVGCHEDVVPMCNHHHALANIETGDDKEYDPIPE